MPHLVTPCHEPLPARRWPALGGATAGLMALILAGCAGGLTGSAAQVPCPAMIEAPVLYPGDTWTVRSEDGRRNRRTYGAERDGLLSLRYSNSDADYYFDHTHTLRKVWSKGQWVTAPTPTFWTPVPGYELESYKIDAGKPATK